jgi:hypothetical protein
MRLLYCRSEIWLAWTVRIAGFGLWGYSFHCIECFLNNAAERAGDQIAQRARQIY